MTGTTGRTIMRTEMGMITGTRMSTRTGMSTGMGIATRLQVAIAMPQPAAPTR